MDPELRAGGRAGLRCNPDHRPVHARRSAVRARKARYRVAEARYTAAQVRCTLRKAWYGPTNARSGLAEVRYEPAKPFLRRTWGTDWPPDSVARRRALMGSGVSHPGDSSPRIQLTESTRLPSPLDRRTDRRWLARGVPFRAGRREFGSVRGRWCRRRRGRVTARAPAPRRQVAAERSCVESAPC
jgi:hypothetical protein